MKGAVCVVTGATSGIGQAAATALARPGVSSARRKLTRPDTQLARLTTTERLPTAAAVRAAFGR